MIWFTADTHFGHANIIKYCNRPFLSVEEMDEFMIDYWNKIVHPGDVVYHLGDFSMGEHFKYLSRLNGSKHLIRGNHDGSSHVVKATGSRGWQSVNDIKEIKIGDVSVVLCHYAMRVWNKSHHGSLQLYGHNHGNLPGTSQSCDVGVDCWGFKPVSLAEIEMRMLSYPPQRGGDTMHREGR